VEGIADFFSKSLIADGTVLMSVILLPGGSVGKLTALSAEHDRSAPTQRNEQLKN
jgi:hypothetical protein